MSSSTGPTEFELLRSEKNRLIQSGYNKGTIRSDMRSLVVPMSVRRHRLISIDYMTALRCHGRGREFESRRPRHFFQGYLCLRSLTKRVARISLKPSRAQKARPRALWRPSRALLGQSSGTGACKCIYIAVYISERQIMAVARVFKSGNSQAVRLPKKFRVKSSEVEIFRRGDEIVLREKAGGMVRVLDLLAELPADMFPKKRKDPQPQRRKGL